jgi:glycosyltransferase involved in cell wall biosynthesis
MKIHSLSLIKNEVDVIAQSLRAAAEWSDNIFVLDNGSTDGTWERVLELAREFPRIIPVRCDPRPFRNAMRLELLSQYRASANDGDWWCILDADMIYIDDPRSFLSGIPDEFQAVETQEIAYFFTDKDLEAFRQDPSLFDDESPIERRLRFYASPDWSEARFARHSEKVGEIGFHLVRPVYPRRIRAKHFQYRSPAQIQKRIETRRDAMQRGSFPHEKRGYWTSRYRCGGVLSLGVLVWGPAPAEEIPERWEERIVNSELLNYDAGNGIYAEGKPWLPPE